MIERGRLQEAQTFYDKAAASAPDVVSETEVQGQKSLLDDAFKAQRGRRDMFTTALARASAGPPTNPDQNALSEAHRLAQTSDEKQSVADIEAKFTKAERHIQGEHDAAISTKLVDFSRRLKATESMDRANSKAIISGLSDLINDIDGAKSQFSKARPAVLVQLDPLLARAKAIQQSIDQENQQADAKTAITSLIGRPAAYEAALEGFAKRFPDSEIAANLKVLEQESHLWEGFTEWDSFASALLGDNETLTPKRARELIAKGGFLEKKYADLQIAELFRSRKIYLDSIASREPENGPLLIAELQKLFRDPLVGNLWLVEAKRSDETRFYTRHEPERENGTLHFKYLAGFNLDEKPQTVRESDVSYIGRAPQSTLAERASTLLNEMSPRDWEKNFTTILDSVNKEERLDPILKITLLQRILKIAAAGSSALGDGFTEYRRELDNATVDLSVNWMDPRDSKALIERKRAEVLLGGLPPISGAIQKAAHNVRRFREPLDYKYTWIGWLSHDADNSWIAITTPLKAEAGELIVIAKSGESAASEPITIGGVEDRHVRLHDGPSSALLTGRPVFLRTKLRASN
jgi:hypothetical protein